SSRTTYGGGRAFRMLPIREAIQAASWSLTSVAEAIAVSNMHCAPNPAGIAEYPQITFDLGWAAGCLFRIVRKFDGRPSVDRCDFADNRDRIEIDRSIRRASDEIIGQVGAP